MKITILLILFTSTLLYSNNNLNEIKIKKHQKHQNVKLIKVKKNKNIKNSLKKEKMKTIEVEMDMSIFTK